MIMITKIMGPTPRRWHLTADGESVLCGMDASKIDRYWHSEMMFYWEPGSKVCSNCWGSRIATNARQEFRFPKSLNPATSTNIFSECNPNLPITPTTPTLCKIRQHQMHSWQPFSDDVINNTTTIARLNYSSESAIVQHFCRIDSEGFLIPCTPEFPDALPLVEIHKREERTMAIKQIIIDTSDDLVYYPVYEPNFDTDLEYDPRPRLKNDYSMVLTTVDRTVITGAIEVALKMPEYFKPRSN